MEDDIEITNEEGAGFEEKIKKIKDELKLCRQEKDEYLAGWQRAKADFINARKDEEKRMEEFAKFNNRGILQEMLLVADSIEIALRHKKSEGMDQIYLQLKEVLRRNGVEEITNVAGVVFNPLEEEAISEAEVDEKEKDGIVLEELQRGYKLYNRVLRPSKVKVGVYKQNI